MSEKPIKPQAELTDRVDCPARPSLARNWLGGTFLLTDAGACYHVPTTEPLRLQRLPDLDGCSAVAVDLRGRLTAGLFDGMLATLLDDEWSYHPAQATVLSLAATSQGLAIGDSAGSVSFGDPPGVAIASAALGEPIVDLAAIDEGVVALGSRGGLWRIGLPEAGQVAVTTLRSNDSLGRPVGLFDTGDPSQVGIFSIERVALLTSDARSPKAGVRRFPEGIGTVVGFDRGEDKASPGYGLLTDAGQVWTISADLNRVSPVILPEAAGEVVGLAGGVGGGLLSWTSGGSAFAIGRDGSSRKLASGDVALAFADPARRDHLALVHWYPDRTVQVRILRPDLAR